MKLQRHRSKHPPELIHHSPVNSDHFGFEIVERSVVPEVEVIATEWVVDIFSGVGSEVTALAMHPHDVSITRAES